IKLNFSCHTSNLIVTVKFRDENITMWDCYSACGIIIKQDNDSKHTTALRCVMQLCVEMLNET
uniref:Uncharacterized protein n=1 Tax=Xiphophorus couchianus TaxID=32473 RepID=A0A3B5LXL6_9TELE